MTPALGLTVYHPDKADHGYTLFAPMTGTSAYLIDMQGRVVHHWALPYRPGAYGYLLGNGHLLVAGRTGKSPVPFGGAGGTLMELDWDGKVLWEHVEDAMHHDFCRLPNGNTMILGWEPVPADLVLHIKGGQPGTEHEGHIWCDYFREVTPEHHVVWEWHGYEHLDVEADRICPLDRRHEWTHANTCEVLPDGNVLTSFRLLNTVAIIDRHSGAFAWKWGREELGHQHDPHLLPNGNVLLFDNGWHAAHPTPRSRVLEVQPTTNTMMVFPYPEKGSDGKYHVRFFSHGLRYVLPAVVQFVDEHLHPGTQLFFMLDPQNPHDPSAVALRTANPALLVGYCPRFLTADVRYLLQTVPATVYVAVERVNRDAPLQLRLLCSLIADWPDNFQPCSDALYEPLA